MIGTWLQSGSPAVAEAIDGLFDYICIDQEHTPVNVETELAILRAVKISPVFVRMREPSFYEAKQHLDLGAAGVIAPMVESEAQAKAVIAACKYPDRGGRRGVGYCRANGYGETLAVSSKPFCCLQIETKGGIENMDAIILTEPDAILLGPYDLAASLGIQMHGPEMGKILSDIVERCEAREIACGTHVVNIDPATLRGCFEEGCTFMAYGTDMEFMRHEISRYITDQKA